MEGSIDRVKLKTRQKLRFTAGVTLTSSYHLHVFKTKSAKTEGHVGEKKIIITLVAQLYHPFISSFKEKWGIISTNPSNTPTLYGSISDLSLSRSIGYNFLLFASVYVPVKCRCQHLLLFVKLCEIYREKKTVLMVSTNTAIFFFSFSDSASRDFL